MVTPLSPRCSVTQHTVCPIAPMWAFPRPHSRMWNANSKKFGTRQPGRKQVRNLWFDCHRCRRGSSSIAIEFFPRLSSRLYFLPHNCARYIELTCLCSHPLLDEVAEVKPSQFLGLQYQHNINYSFTTFPGCIISVT